MQSHRQFRICETFLQVDYLVGPLNCCSDTEARISSYARLKIMKKNVTLKIRSDSKIYRFWCSDMRASTDINTKYSSGDHVATTEWKKGRNNLGSQVLEPYASQASMIYYMLTTPFWRCLPDNSTCHRKSPGRRRCYTIQYSGES